jgi:hypothetical protein
MRRTTHLPRASLRSGTALALLLLLSGLVPLAAQDEPVTDELPPDETTTGDAADASIARFSIPESPAFVFLDATPANVTRPTAPREFAAAFINGIDNAGRVRQGLAVEFQPALLTRPISLETYQRRGIKYILSTAQLSLGTVRSSGDSGATDLAYGIRLLLYDRTDPMADRGFTGELADALGGCTPAVAPDFPGHRDQPLSSPTDSATAALEARITALEDEAGGTDAAACLDAAVDSLATAYARAHWNDLTFGLAWARGHRLTDARFSNSTDLGDRLWLVGGAPVGSYGQLQGYLQWSHTRANADSAKATFLAYGARLTLGSSTLNGFLDVVGESRRGGPAAGKKTTASWTGGIEFRLSDQLWLATGFGRDGRLTQTDGPNVLLANLKWGLSDRARFGRARSEE